MSKHDFGETRIKELEKELERVKKVAEVLIVTVFSICELRDLWRVKFGLPKKCEDVRDNGDFNEIL